MGKWRRSLSDLADIACAINRVKPFLFRGTYGQEQVCASVSLIDQDGRGAWRQAVANADGVRHSDRNIGRPSTSGKGGLLIANLTVATVSDDAVADHRAAKQFDSGVLLCRGKGCNAAGLRQSGDQAAMNRVRRLFYPAAKCQPSLFYEIEQLRNRIGAVLGVQ